MRTLFLFSLLLSLLGDTKPNIAAEFTCNQETSVVNCVVKEHTIKPADPDFVVKRMLLFGYAVNHVLLYTLEEKEFVSTIIVEFLDGERHTILFQDALDCLMMSESFPAAVVCYSNHTKRDDPV